MFAGVRPYVTAGVALVGASVIAIAPVAPPPTATTEVSSASPAVQLAAIPSPLAFYPRVFGTSLQNAGALLEAFLADPFPITRATAINQVAALADAVAAIQDGDGDRFLTAIGDVVLEPLRSVTSAVSYMGTWIAQPFALEYLGAMIVSPVLNGLAAVRAAVTDVIEAAVAFDVLGVVNAVLNIPGRIIDGILNGGYEPLGFFDLGGLLSPADEEGGRPLGPIAMAMMLARQIADTIPARPAAETERVSNPEVVADTQHYVVATETPSLQANLLSEVGAASDEPNAVLEGESDGLADESDREAGEPDASPSDKAPPSEETPPSDETAESAEVGAGAAGDRKRVTTRLSGADKRQSATPSDSDSTDLQNSGAGDGREPAAESTG